MVSGESTDPADRARGQRLQGDGVSAEAEAMKSAPAPASGLKAVAENVALCTKKIRELQDERRRLPPGHVRHMGTAEIPPIMYEIRKQIAEREGWEEYGRYYRDLAAKERPVPRPDTRLP